LLRLTPADATQGNFTNTAINLNYTATQAKQCAAVTLADSAGNPVATRTLYQNEWTHPLGGVAGTLTLSPLDVLQPGATYYVRQAGAPVGSFTTADSAARRGRVVAVTDQPVAFSSLPNSSVLSAHQINDMLPSLVKDAVRNNVARKLAELALRKEAPNLAKPHARYSAVVKKLTYTSSRADGTPIVLSGLLVYPQNLDGSAFNFNGAPMVLAQHGSMHSTNPAPSSAKTADVTVGLMAAGRGQVYFAPDLIGLGDTVTQPQAYLLTLDTALASQDMWMAVRQYITQQFDGARLGRDLRIFGISQGGYSAMAVLPYFSDIADVKSVYAGEGPFDVYRTLQASLLTLGGAPRDAYARYENLGFVPGHLRSILQTYRAYQGLSYNDAAVFTANGQLQPTFLRDFSQNKYPQVMAHMGVNSLLGGNQVYNAPQAKVVLFHYAKDSLVPAQNTTDMLGYLQNGRHQLGSVSRGNCYENSVFVKLFLMASKSEEKTHTVCALYTIDRFVGEL
jgi:hypothetical protein